MATNQYATVSTVLVSGQLRRFYIGTREAAASLATLRRHDITHIVNCAIEIPSHFDDVALHGIRYCRLELDDDDGDDIVAACERAVSWVRDAVPNDTSSGVLVHCAAGVSRSPTVMAAIVAALTSLPSWLSALYYVQASHRWTRPDDAYFRTLAPELWDAADGDGNDDAQVFKSIDAEFFRRCSEEYDAA